MLDIGRAKQSQTATPNNTPLVTTPPKSPVPEEEMLEIAERLSSNSSSVELVCDAGITPDSEEQQAFLKTLVQERMQSLEVKPGM